MMKKNENVLEKKFLKAVQNKESGKDIFEGLNISSSEKKELEQIFNIEQHLENVGKNIVPPKNYLSSILDELPDQRKSKTFWKNTKLYLSVGFAALIIVFSAYIFAKKF